MFQVQHGFGRRVGDEHRGVRPQRRSPSPGQTGRGLLAFLTWTSLEIVADAADDVFQEGAEPNFSLQEVYMSSKQGKAAILEARLQKRVGGSSNRSVFVSRSAETDAESSGQDGGQAAGDQEGGCGPASLRCSGWAWP